MDSKTSISNSGIDSYWHNYRRVEEWRSNHYVALLESKLNASRVENALLHNFIRDELQRKSSRADADLPRDLSESNYCHGNFVAPHLSPESQSESISEDSETEISEEMLAFYEQTVRHRMEHKKQILNEKQQEEKEVEFQTNDELHSVSPLHFTHGSEDMKVLYGDAAAKISSMELSMQINFDSNRMKANAPMWPNIPLRLS